MALREEGRGRMSGFVQGRNRSHQAIEPRTIAVGASRPIALSTAQPHLIQGNLDDTDLTVTADSSEAGDVNPFSAPVARHYVKGDSYPSTTSGQRSPPPQHPSIQPSHPAPRISFAPKVHIPAPVTKPIKPIWRQSDWQPLRDDHQHQHDVEPLPLQAQPEHMPAPLETASSLQVYHQSEQPSKTRTKSRQRTETQAIGYANSERPLVPQSDSERLQDHMQRGEEGSLDHAPPSLYQMEFKMLRDEQFDFDPNAGPFKWPTDMRPLTTLAEKLMAVAHLPQDRQVDFFAHLDISEWEEAGEWFVGRFGETVGQLIRARQEKRQTARRFESEVEMAGDMSRTSMSGGGCRRVETKRRRGEGWICGRRGCGECSPPMSTEGFAAPGRQQP
ncbi:hypothetical protein K470DRAFT_2939 [Piedraia hortae CBS 480.64]|uniref:Extracellular mutant protein 11 C-terminal domain-containing protein n=1 Tax=Piedraia hortae CBS 480.64 TaxID=1314780 RepID=A0A6A7CDD9_9PEZI|nr:hypothetical protein K470DRAFT_2939 [Piedraia hortae CBS 480.64]